MTLNEVLDHYGGRDQRGINLVVAAALGVEPAAISNWKARGFIPYRTQCQIQVATKGKLKADMNHAKQPAA